MEQITKEDLKAKVKNVPTVFVELNGKEFTIKSVLRALNEILNTEEDDKYGEYSLSDYELSYDSYHICKTLVDMGLVRNYVGSRMADLYCIASGCTETLINLMNTMYDLLEELEDDEN